MKQTIIITFIVLVIGILFIYVNIKNNLLINLKSLNFSAINMNDVINPTVNITTVIEIINNSMFSLVIKNFIIEVYNGSELIVNSTLQKTTEINKGINNITLVFNNFKLLQLLNNNQEYDFIIYFRFLGVKIKTIQKVNFSTLL